MSWESICKIEDIILDSGVAALIGDQQIAVFRVLINGEEQVFAVGNYDPFSNANVISRGIVGSVGDDVVVSSPIYKQHFRLVDGSCLEDETVSLGSWPVLIDDGEIKIGTMDKEAAA